MKRIHTYSPVRQNNGDTSDAVKRAWVERQYQQWPGYRHVSTYLTYIRPRLEALRSPEISRDAMAGDWLRNFRKALQLRITLKGLPPRGRKWDSTYQTELYRDCRSIRDNRQRCIRLHQIMTPELRDRFAHLVSERD